MKASDLEALRPRCLSASLPSWTYYMDHYMGGLDYPSKSNPLPIASRGLRPVAEGSGATAFSGTAYYLWQHPLEENLRYGHRLARSTYIDVLAPVVDLYAGTIGRPENITIENNGPAFDEFRDDCDLRGTSYVQFMTRVRTNAMILGWSSVLVDSTRPTAPVETQRDVIDQKIRPYMVEVLPWDILSYRLDTRGRLIDVLYRSRAEYTGTAMTAPGDEKFEYRRWTTTTWELWKEDDKGEVVLVEGMEHQLGHVPLHIVYNEKGKEPFEGASLIRSSAKIGQLVTNWVSSLDESFENQMFAVPVLKSRSKPSEVGVGTTTVLHLNPEDGEEFSYVTPDTTPFEASWASVFRMIGFANKQMGMNPSAITDTTIEQKSGVSKAWDYHEASSRMTKVALNEQEAGRNIFFSVARWLGVDKYPTPVYSAKYDLSSLKDDLDSLNSMMEMSFPDEALRAMGRRVTQKALPSLTEKEERDITKAIETWDPELLTIKQDSAETNPERRDETQPSKKQKQGTLR